MSVSGVGVSAFVFGSESTRRRASLKHMLV